MRYTKKFAAEILGQWKNDTAFFDGTLNMTEPQFEAMLRTRMGFGLAESIVITMALIMAGAKFRPN